MTLKDNPRKESL